MKNAKNRPRKKLGGPYLAAALFCEQVVTDQSDGALTMVRIIDSIKLELPAHAPPNMPSKESPVPIRINGLVSFKTGDSPGKHSVKILAEAPSGKRQIVYDGRIDLSKVPHGGANLRIQNYVEVTHGGLFWLHVILDGKRVTRMPIEILITRAVPQKKSAAAGKNR